MRIVARLALVLILLVPVWGCTVDYHAAPPPSERVPLTEREWAVLNKLSEQLDQTRKQLADTRAEVAAMRGRLNAAEGAVEEIRSGVVPGAGSGNVKDLDRRLATLEAEVKTRPGDTKRSRAGSRFRQCRGSPSPFGGPRGGGRKTARTVEGA
jgi:hypothetical protein